MLHADHVELLEYAAQYGELLVGINGHAANVLKYQDKAVPVESRRRVLQALRAVQEVLVFEGPDPRELLRQVQPDLLVKGPDYQGIPIPEDQVCQELGVKILYRPGLRLYSSSSILTGATGAS